MYRRLEIEACANGFIASVGCQRLVYTGETREIAAKLLCDDLEAYLIDPDKAESAARKGKCFNLQHTLLEPRVGERLQQDYANVPCVPCVDRVDCPPSRQP